MINYKIIKRPLVTEKTVLMKEKSNQFSFEVDRAANRIEIRRAVEQIFKVRVGSVKTIQVKGKTKQKGRIVGKRKDWKKAIVRLFPGERIEFFEGV
jgi:large subunit ribosomal protein L23